MGDNSLDTSVIVPQALLTSGLMGGAAAGIEYLGQKSTLKHPDRLKEAKEEADQFIKANEQFPDLVESKKYALKCLEEGKINYKAVRNHGLSAALIGALVSLAASLMFGFSNKKEQKLPNGQ